MCPHCLLMIIIGGISSGGLACCTFLKHKFLGFKKKSHNKNRRGKNVSR